MADKGLNKVQLIGRLGRDPEMRYTPTGKAVAHFSLAVNQARRDEAGNRVEVAEWFNVVAWEGLAETCNEYLRKGSRCYVEGRLQSRRYTDAEGQPRAAIEVVAGDLVMLDGRRDTTGQAAAGTAPAAGATGGPAPGDEAMPF
jgi:single-strand DNA-binding protein